MSALNASISMRTSRHTHITAQSAESGLHEPRTHCQHHHAHDQRDAECNVPVWVCHSYILSRYASLNVTREWMWKESYYLATQSFYIIPPTAGGKAIVWMTPASNDWLPIRLPESTLTRAVRTGVKTGNTKSTRNILGKLSFEAHFTHVLD
jgi:hypothetical protein